MIVGSLGTSRRILCLALSAIFVLAGSDAVNAAKGRGKKGPSPQQRTAAERKAIHERIRRAQAQLLAAQQVLSVTGQRAATADAKAAAAAGQASSAVARIEAAESDAKIADEALEALANQIEESQAADSPLVQAKTRYREAAQALHDAEDRALNAPEVKQQSAAAKLSGDGERLAAIRSEALDNSREYQMAKLVYRTTKSVYDDLRHKLLTSNEDWRAASEDLRKLRQDLARAEQELKGAKLHEAGAKDQRREAERIAAPAQAVAAQAAAKLNQLQSRERQLTHKQHPKNSSKKKR